MKILVYGSINIDLVYQLDHIVRPGETVASTDMARTPGGKGANQASALAKAGTEVYLAGKVGSDGQFLLDLVKSYGVNIDHVMIYDGPTGNAIIQIDKNKQNAIFLFAGGNGEITVEEVNRVINSFDRGDIIILQNEIAHLGEIIESASKRGLKICLNPSPYTPAIEKLPLDKIDIFFVNEIEGFAMAGFPAEEKNGDTAALAGTALEKIAGRFPNAEIILTAGEYGAFYAHGTERAAAPIVNVKVVDTVGAGDTFSGYFIAARIRGLDAQAALNIAGKAASIAVSRPGAMASVPLAHEVF